QHGNGETRPRARKSRRARRPSCGLAAMDRGLRRAYTNTPLFTFGFEMTSEPSARAPHVSLSTLLSVFFRVGLASFGGSTAAFLYREVVKTRGWMSEEEFLAALTLSQVMPGANP